MNPIVKHHIKSLLGILGILSGVFFLVSCSSTSSLSVVQPSQEILRNNAKYNVNVLPAKIFFAAFDYGADGQSISPNATVTVNLPYKLTPNAILYTYHYDSVGNQWLNRPNNNYNYFPFAVVQSDGLTAQVQVSVGGSYALFLTDDWKTRLYSSSLVFYNDSNIPSTDISGATVVVQGKKSDAAVLNEVVRLMKDAGMSTSNANVQSYFTDAFDSTTTNIQVLELTTAVTVLRYWSPEGGAYGRYFLPSFKNMVERPEDAKINYALPSINDATFATLYTLKAGTRVIYGICADVSGQTPLFNPKATGLGAQFFIPNATVYSNGAIHVNTTAMTEDCVVSFRKAISYSIQRL